MWNCRTLTKIVDGLVYILLFLPLLKPLYLLPTPICTATDTYDKHLATYVLESSVNWNLMIIILTYLIERPFCYYRFCMSERKKNPSLFYNVKMKLL